MDISQSKKFEWPIVHEKMSHTQVNYLANDAAVFFWSSCKTLVSKYQMTDLGYHYVQKVPPPKKKNFPIEGTDQLSS